MSPLLPVSVDGSLPIQLEAAPHDLCRAACAGRLKIKGSKWGTEESETVPIAAGFSVVDRYEEREGYCRATIVDPASAIGQVNYNHRYTNYWKHLYVSAAECRACWPSATAPAKGDAPADAGERTAPPRRATPDQMREWMFQHQSDLKGAKKGHGRDIILADARQHFGVAHKIVLDVWKDTASQKRRLDLRSRGASIEKSP